MARHIAHRLMISLPVLLGVLLIGFLLLQVVPTDPATVVAGPTASAAEVAAIRQQMGLDQPLWIQFARYLGRGLQLIQYVGGAGLLPFQGRNGPIWTAAGALSLVLPAITLGAVFVGPVARMTRTSLLETLGADYVRTARAKGAS